MSVKVITPPSQQISTVDLKAHLRVTSSAEDTLIVGYLETAVSVCRGYTHRSIGQQTLELALDAFPAAFELPLGPTTSIASVKYQDSANVTQTIDPANYSLDNYEDNAWLLPVPNYSWPAPGSVANAVKVRYVAGDMHPAVRGVLLLMVGILYDNRGTPVDLLSGFPVFKEMLNPAKLKWVLA